ncbi:hypothetical protein Barb6_02365 [Bacteroidales bacterium Barb6]|nr:hypothetical protein Barb6_02365 [Bacteroidales bacterium Barb6]
MKKANPASLHRANLLRSAQKEEVIFQFVIIRYLHEHLLYRLSVSDYVSKFCLKGGALFKRDRDKPVRVGVECQYVIGKKGKAM